MLGPTPNPTLAIVAAALVALSAGCGAEQTERDGHDVADAADLAEADATADPGADAPAPPGCGDPSAPGPYEVTREPWRPEDPIRGGTLEATLWYPSRAGAPDTSGAPYPLVTLSHGFLMDPPTYDGVARRVASHGFVVVGTEHVDTAEAVVEAVAGVCAAIPRNEQLARVDEVFAAIFERNHAFRRVGDLTTLIDAAAARSAPGGDLAGLIDTERVGAIGHSFGGFTSFAAAGAEVDVDGIVAACAGGPSLADLISGETLRFLICSLFASTDAELLGQPLVLRDERIAAMVSLAAPLELVWGPEFGGLAAIPVPVMLVYTDTDESVDYEDAALAAFPSFPSPTGFLTVLGGNHGNFGEIDFERYAQHVAAIPEDCNYRSFVASFAGDPEAQPALPNALQVELAAAAAAGFLQAHLAGAVGCEPYLDAAFFESIGGEAQRFESR